MIFKFFAAVLFFIFSSSVLAQVSPVVSTCSSILSQYSSYVSSGNTASADATKASHPECFGSSGSEAAAAKDIQGTSFEQISAIFSALGSRNNTMTAPPGQLASGGHVRGMAAGNATKQWNLWGGASQTNQEYDRGVFSLSTPGFAGDRTNKYDNSITNALFGADYLLDPAVALGLSVGVDRGSGSASSYTIAAPTAAKNVSTSGYSVAPYLGWQINKDWALDATLGVGRGKNVVDNSVRTSLKRDFWGLNLSYVTWQDKWQLTGKAGYLFGREKSSDSVDDTRGTLTGTAMNNSVGQARLSGQIAYWADGVMPYFGVSFLSDSRTSNASADEKFSTEMGTKATVWSLGLNFISVKNGVTGGIGYEKETGRSRSKNDKVMANISFRY